MKKIISLIIALITIITCITSCSSENDKKDDDEKISVDENKKEEEIPKDENKLVGDVFLTVPGQSSPSKVTGFGSAFDYGVDTGTSGSCDEVFEELENTEKTLFNGTKTFVYEKSDCRFKNRNTSKYGTFYCIYDKYVEKGTDGETRVEFLHGTDILTYYNTPVGRQSSTATMEDCEIRKAAEDFILTVISEEEFSKYADGRILEYPVKGLFAIRYMRYVANCTTDDYISVVMTSKGKVVSYTAFSFGKYDNLELKFTEENVSFAYDKLLAKVNSMHLKNPSMSKPSIVTDTSGNPFIKVVVEYDTDDGGRNGDYLYVNIQ